MTMEVQVLLVIATIISIIFNILVIILLWQQRKEMTWLKATVLALQNEQRNITILMLAGQPDKGAMGGEVLLDIPVTIGEKALTITFDNGAGPMRIPIKQGALSPERAGRTIRLCLYDVGETQ